MIDLSIEPTSPLRRFDPRGKLVACLLVCCFAVPLAGWGLYVLLGVVLLGLVWSRLWRRSMGLVKRLALPVAVLFVLQACVKDVEFAAEMTARIFVASLSFCFLIYSTTPEEIAAALRKLGVSRPHAHAAVMMVEQAPIILGELAQLRETYRQRHGVADPGGRVWTRVRGALRMARRIIAPMLIMSVHRAWALSEAAYARGMESRRPGTYLECRMGWADWLLLLGVAAAIASAWHLR